MISILLLGTPGHLMPGGTARVRVHESKPGYGRVFVEPRDVNALTQPNADLCRFVQERSP